MRLTLSLTSQDRPTSSRSIAPTCAFQDVGTWGYRHRRIQRVVDTLHFAPSSESRLLQAVDLIAFLYHRIATTKSGTDMRQVRANRTLWARIDQKVWHRYLWRP